VSDIVESDEELVRRVRASDPGAAEELFERHLPRLRAAARSRLPAALRGKIGESDVIQEAYLAAFLGLAAFEDRGDGSFARWLRGILDKRLADEVRRLATEKRDLRREVRLATGADASPRTPAPSPSQAAIDVETTAEMHAAIGGLSADHATVLRHVHVEGLTLAETARRMGRSADAVEKLHARALAKLGKRLPRPTRP